MILPKDVLSGTYMRPNCFLCTPDKTTICKLETTNMSGSFKFNSYSTLNFDVARTYNNIHTGETLVNPYYNQIEAIRLVYLEGFGYFEIQDPEINGDGIKEIKSVTANSLEYTLAQKYLETFYVNQGTVDSIEVLYMEEKKNKAVIPVTFYNKQRPELSLLHLILEKVPDWTIGHIDESLKTMSRQFEIERESVYDFIMNELCEKFNCYAIFDTINNTINFYAEALTNKFIGDGKTKTFTVSPVFFEIDSVSVDGYKTSSYTYNSSTGLLTLTSAPALGEVVEVTDGSLTDWETDVFVSFNNLAQQMNISYSADDIKTVLTVKGADDLDIREVNVGLPYVADLSYFHTVEWMGQELYDAYNKYAAKCTSQQEAYKNNAANILMYSNKKWYEENRLSLGYATASVSADTVGTYYVRGGDASSGYYYTEVSLPADYIVGTTYYSVNTANLDETKMNNLYEALKTYYNGYYGSKPLDVSGFTDDLMTSFQFTETSHPGKYTMAGLKHQLARNEMTPEEKDERVVNVLVQIWDELGLTPLKTLYLPIYKALQVTAVSAGGANKNHGEYGSYYATILMIKSLNKAIAARQITVDSLQASLDQLYNANTTISNDLSLDNEENFSKAQRILLNRFLREDEYTDDTFVLTGNETTEELFKLKQHLKECGQIELSKLCEPKLKFSMSLANIYALPEFEPIIDQFQLGNLIKVALRPDYIKHTRLMQVNLNFEDFSDFSCEFGDLMSIRSQSDLHADLLSQAIGAGKTVAGNKSHWDKGTDTATAIDARVQQGLLDAATEIKSISATQSVVIDDYGIHLYDKNPNTDEVSNKQGWIVNNRILYSDDGFDTAKSVFGEYKIDGEEYWGLLAEAVIAGYIEGSTIKGGTIEGSDIFGGTIHIGKRTNGDGYNFEVSSEGIITMRGGTGVDSNGNEYDIDEYNTTVELVSDHTVLSAKREKITLTCKVFSYDVDVTNTYKSKPIFKWTRSSDNNEKDQEWNDAQKNESTTNTLTITEDDVADVAFFQCEVQLSVNTSKCTNTIGITLSSSDIHVFTSKPKTKQTNGYYYRKGDLWVVGEDFQPHLLENGESEQLTYEWYVKSPGSSQPVLSAITKNEYSVEMTSDRDGNELYCIAKDSKGNTIQSNTVTFKTPNKADLTILRDITHRTVSENERARVSFQVDGTNLTYTWYYKDTNMKEFARTNSFTSYFYDIEMTEARAGRQIYCVAEDQSGKRATSNTVTLNMINEGATGSGEGGSWRIKKQPASQRVAIGQTATATFDVAGLKCAQNLILVSTADATSYSDDHWVESTYYSKAFKDLDSRTTKIEQHVVIDSDGLHLIGDDTEKTGQKFEALLTSDELGFYHIKSGQNPKKIVWIGDDDMNARNVTAENYLNIQAEQTENKTSPYLQLGEFKFKIENDGSLSLT